MERPASERLTLGLSAGYSVDDFVGIDRTDGVLSFGVDARYQITPHVWFGPSLRHVERRSDVAGEDFAANIAMIRLGADLEPAWTGADPALWDGRSEFYYGFQGGHGMFASASEGTRGSTGLVESSFGAPGWTGGVFAGWRAVSGGVMTGVEAEMEAGDGGWRHDAGRTFGAERGTLYAVSLLGGLETIGGGFAYVRGGVANMGVQAAYLHEGSVEVSDERCWGARLGAGVEAPVFGGLSLRAEYVVTAFEDRAIGGDMFSDVESGGRIGLP